MQTEQPEKKAVSFYEASGFSMWPFLKKGERIIIRETPPDELKKGDAILYQRDGAVVCHRVIKKYCGGEGIIFFTRGDNSFAAPERVLASEVLGKAIAVKKGKKITSLTSGKNRLIGLCIIATAPFRVRLIRILGPVYRRFKRFAGGLRTFV
ncbi:MAG: signal peptidase I [Candidatus Omnitrophica bacterium]|nr:signal peptidase I [Candidatus Omnitrophota bacterium]